MNLSQTLKEEGIARAVKGKEALLEKARRIATDIALEVGFCHSDLLAEAMGDEYSELGATAGAVFKTGFIFTGRRVISAQPNNHGRELKVWKLPEVNLD